MAFLDNNFRDTIVLTILPTILNILRELGPNLEEVIFQNWLIKYVSYTYYDDITKLV